MVYFDLLHYMHEYIKKFAFKLGQNNSAELSVSLTSSSLHEYFRVVEFQPSVCLTYLSISNCFVSIWKSTDLCQTRSSSLLAKKDKERSI